MNGLLNAAAEVQRFCESHGWQFCFIGGLVVQRWGEPRQTRDVDLTLLTGFGAEEAFVDEVLSRFAGRGDDAREFALMHRVLLVTTAAGVDVDVALGALPFEERAVNRASAWEITGDLALTTCSAEDLVVYKAFAGRAQDWVDVEGILLRQGGRLNHALILDEEPRCWP